MTSVKFKGGDHCKLNTFDQAFLLDINIEPFKLDLSHNAFDRIPDLTKLTNLHDLDMSFNHLTALNTYYHPHTLPTSLKFIDFSSNNIAAINFEYFKHFPHLISLLLNHNAMYYIQFLFFDSPHVKRVEMSACKLKHVSLFFDESIKEIYMDTIDLSRNDLRNYVVISNNVIEVGLLDLSEQKTNKFINNRSIWSFAFWLPNRIGRFDLRNNNIEWIDDNIEWQFFFNIDLSFNNLPSHALCELFGQDVRRKYADQISAEVTFFPQKIRVLGESSVLTCEGFKSSARGFKPGILKEIRPFYNNDMPLVRLKDCDYDYRVSHGHLRSPCTARCIKYTFNVEEMQCYN